MGVTSNSSRALCKKNLAIQIVAMSSLGIVPQVNGQISTSWNGNAGDVWTRPGSWNNFVPGDGSIALINGGSGNTLALREGTLAGGISVGTLIVTNPSYTSFVTGASAASMNFNSGTTAAGAIEYRPGGTSAATVTFGGQTQNLVLNIGTLLNVSVENGKTLALHNTISGSGKPGKPGTVTYFCKRF